MASWGNYYLLFFQKKLKIKHMGCHTWFYNKLEVQPTYEEMREKYLAHLIKEMGYHERYISGTLSEREKFLFYNRTVDDSKHCLSILKRIYQIVEKRLCKLATCRHMASILQLSFCKRNNSFYKDINEVHDIFRIGGYPDTELLSLEETLQFFEERGNDISWGNLPSEIGKKAVIEKIKGFWTKYPNGRIIFG